MTAAPQGGGTSETPGLPRRLSLGGALGGLNAVGTLWTFALLLLINADVLGRFLLNSPIRGVPELVALSIVGIVFLQLPHTLRVGRMTRSDVFIGKLLAERPRIGAALDCAYDLIGVGLFALLVTATLPLFQRAWDEDLYVGAAGDFTAPEWPVKLIVVIGCVAAAVQYLVLAYAKAKAALSPGAPERARP